MQPTEAPPVPRLRNRHLARNAGVALALLVLLAAAALAVIGWYYAGVLHDEAFAVDHGPDPFNLVAGETADGRVTLLTTAATEGDGWADDGIMGLAWDGGWAILGPIVERGRDRVVRTITEGTPPPPGTPVRLDGWVFPGDPLAAYGIPFETVTVEGELGPLPAWYLAGERDTWAIAIHGRNATRREALRTLPTLREAGLPVLVITYRDDEGVAPDPGGIHGLGATEWPDLEAAVAYALGHGASQVVLVGYSMGGGIALSFMEHSPLAASVRALVLESPLISFDAAVNHQAAGRGLPAVVTAIGKRFASWRFGIDWDALDYRDTARRLRAPVLLFHVTGDRAVPASGSIALARDNPVYVTLVTTEGVGHVRSWNLDPARYEQALSDFLMKVFTQPALTARDFGTLSENGQRSARLLATITPCTSRAS